MYEHESRDLLHKLVDAVPDRDVAHVRAIVARLVAQRAEWDAARDDHEQQPRLFQDPPLLPSPYVLPHGSVATDVIAASPYGGPVASDVIAALEALPDDDEAVTTDDLKALAAGRAAPVTDLLSETELRDELARLRSV